MEFLRFGSSIPGGYWGCCAVCIIQNFKFDPSVKASIQMVSGDGGYPMLSKASEEQFAGPTYHDIFKARLRVGTFSNTDMPNHTFFAVLTEGQLTSSYGKKWLAILKEEGFEFVRTVDNSVYTGPKLYDGTVSEQNSDEYYDDEDEDGVSSHKNYIFALYRNIGQGRIDDPYEAPEQWTSLPDPYNGDMSVTNQYDVQRALWEKLGPATFHTEKEIEALGAPVTLAGRRVDGAAPETRKARTERERASTKKGVALSKAAPW